MLGKQYKACIMIQGTVQVTLMMIIDSLFCNNNSPSVGTDQLYCNICVNSYIVDIFYIICFLLPAFILHCTWQLSCCFLLLLAHASYIRADRNLLMGHDILLSNQIHVARDPLHTLSHEHGNPWHGLW